jgi:hypothetical protein
MILYSYWYDDDNTYLAEILSRLNAQVPLIHEGDNNDLGHFVEPVQFVLDVLSHSINPDLNSRSQHGLFQGGIKLPTLAVGLNELKIFFPISHGAIKTYLNGEYRNVTNDAQPNGFNNVLNTPYFEFISFLRIIYLAQSDIQEFRLFLQTWLPSWAVIELGYYCNRDEVARFRSFEINKWPMRLIDSNGTLHPVFNNELTLNNPGSITFWDRFQRLIRDPFYQPFYDESFHQRFYFRRFLMGVSRQSNTLPDLSIFQIVPNIQRFQKQHCSFYINEEFDLIAYINPKLYLDFEFMIGLCAVDATAIWFIDLKYLDDFDLFKSLFVSNEGILRVLHPRRIKSEYCLRLLEIDVDNFEYMPDFIKSHPDFSSFKKQYEERKRENNFNISSTSDLPF